MCRLTCFKLFFSFAIETLKAGILNLIKMILGHYGLTPLGLVSFWFLCTLMYTPKGLLLSEFIISNDLVWVKKNFLAKSKEKAQIQTIWPECKYVGVFEWPISKVLNTRELTILKLTDHFILQICFMRICWSSLISRL